eukprot:3344324-Pyramimonas_sp.AAC.1
MCGCSFPWVSGRKNNDASWGRVFESDARDGSGLTHMGARYEDGNDKLYLQKHIDEFDDWTVNVWCASSIGVPRGYLELVCCPEDQRCSAACRAKREVCTQCEVLLCRECFEGVYTPKRAWNETSHAM